MNNRTIAALFLLLLVQVGLALALDFSSHNYTAFKSNERLIAINSADIDTLEIADKDGNQLVLKRVDGRWQLPSVHDFPASTTRVQQLLDNLTSIDKSWPIATTASAAERFKVSKQEYEQRIVFKRGTEIQATLYLGTSPGFRKVHARVAGNDDVYAIQFATYEVSAKPDFWEDKDYLQQKDDQVTEIQLPKVILKHNDQKWLVADLNADEQNNTAEVNMQIPQLLNPGFVAVIGDDVPRHDPEPAFQYVIKLRSGKEVGFKYYKMKDADDYVLEASQHPFRFKASKMVVDRLLGIARSDLVQPKTAEKSNAPANPTKDAAGVGSAGAPTSNNPQ